MAKIIKDDIDKFFEYGIYPETRTIYISSNDGSDDDGVGTTMAERAIKGLHLLDIKEGKIFIILNTSGGDEYHGLAIYDAIKQCRNHVEVKVLGQASSMGSIILQAADSRILSPNSRVMIHHGTPLQASDDDHAKSNYKWAEECKKFSRWMLNMYWLRIKEKHPRFDKRKLDKMLDFDTILDAKGAVDLGLADKVDYHG